MRRGQAPAAPTIDPVEARRLVYCFVRSLCRRLTKGGDPEADQRACHVLARRLVAQDPTLAGRLQYTLGLDRVLDPDEADDFVVANGLAVLTLDVYLQLRKLNDTGDVEAARHEIEKIVRNWSDLVAGVPGAIRRGPSGMVTPTSPTCPLPLVHYPIGSMIIHERSFCSSRTK